jgi:hypothetical protein
MTTPEQKLEAAKQPHAVVFSTSRASGFAHLKASICLDVEESYAQRVGHLEVFAQIGQHEADMIRRDLRAKSPSDRAYGNRLHYDSTNHGLTAQRLKVLSAIVGRFEKDESRFAGFTPFMLAAFGAAKIRHVFLEPDSTGWKPPEQCEMLDLRKPADIVRFAEWMDARADALWTKACPASVVAQVRRQLEDEAAQVQAEDETPVERPRGG